MAGIIFSKSSNLNDSVFGKSAEPIMMFIESKAEAFEQESVMKKVFKQTKSKNFGEKLTSMTSMDNFLPVGEGGAYPQVDMQEGYDKILLADTFKSKFVITKEAIEDNKILDTRKPLGFTTSYYRTREQFAASLYLGGVTGKEAVLNGRKYSILGADDKPVFAGDHPSKVKGGVQSNKYAGVFNVDMLAKMETAMQNYKDDNGNLLNVAPDTILIPNDYALKKAVFEAIGADKDPATANNGFNYQFGRWNVAVWPYLNGLIGTDKPYILLDSNYNDSYGGAVWIDRVPLSVKTWVDENNDNNIWSGRARFTAGFNDWRFASVGGVTGGTTL